MAPEQALGETVNERSDIYSLGVITYRLVTGVPPVKPGEVPSMLHEVVYRMPVQPSRVAEVSPQVEAVIAIAMAKTPGDRFAKAGELAAALADAVDGKLPRETQVRREDPHEDAVGQLAAKVLITRSAAARRCRRDGTVRRVAMDRAAGDLSSRRRARRR